MNRSPRVLAVMGMSSACERYRILNPLWHLKQQGYIADWTSNTRLATMPKDLLRNYDVLILPRLGLETEEEQEKMDRDIRELGLMTVFEIDDDLFNMPPWNPSTMFDWQIEALKRQIRSSDLVTVTNRHLQVEMQKYNDNVAILPNCVDPDFWDVDLKAIRKVEGLTVGVQGGHSHVRDWEVLAEVIPEVARLRPEVVFVVAGYHPDYIVALKESLGERLVLLGWVPVDEHPAIVAQIDIALCPLIDDHFNASKSPVKAFEAAMVGAPVVASLGPIYSSVIQHGVSGFLAQAPEAWVKWIVKLVDKPKLRRQMGAALRGEVLRHHNIHNEASLWMKAYSESWHRFLGARA
jgi:glycosyltransferase involved in cell wall biosynthesis